MRGFSWLYIASEPFPTMAAWTVYVSSRLPALSTYLFCSCIPTHAQMFWILSPS